MPPPWGPRITSGTVGRPPSMKRNFAAWLTSWSIVSATKSKIWISTTGRSPAIAAPTPAPTNVASEIGVSRTRSSPKRSRSPRVTPKMPPIRLTSAPLTNTPASLALAGARHRRAPGLVHGEDVVTVHADARDPVRRGARGDRLARRRARGRGREGVLVVLAEVDGRQLPHGGEVERLVDDALVGAAVAEEGDDDVVGPPELGGEPRAGADREPGRDDPVTAQDVQVERGDVHRASQAAAVAVLPAHELRHHAVHARALGDAVAVAAMGADDVVALAEVRAGARRHRLLADVAVRRPLDEPGVEELRRLLVEAADLDHRGVEALELLAAELHSAPPGVGPPRDRR